MTELYWITRLDSLCDSLTFIMIASGILSVITIFASIVCWFNKPKGEEPKYDEIPAEYYLGFKKWGKRILIVFIMTLIIRTLVPTTNQCLLIYGVGGTIDWVKSNPTAKNLPNKCIIALDKWVDKISQDSIK